MSDLISRKAVIDIIHKEIERTSSFAEHETQINIEMAVSELPTAFDTEQVIHNLECEKTIWCGKKITTTDVMKIDDAIDIVKKGGVE